MGREYNPEVVWQAQEMYCVDRLTFARVAQITGASASTLKRWAEKYKWRQKREEIAACESDIRVNTIRGRQVILERLLTAENGKEASQVAFAVASLENLALKQAELAASGKIPSVVNPDKNPKIASRQDAANALRTAIEQKLGLALSDPKNITAQTVKDIVQCLDLLADLETSLPKTETAEDTHNGLSGDVADKLYKALGIGKEDNKNE